MNRFIKILCSIIFLTLFFVQTSSANCEFPDNVNGVTDGNGIQHNNQNTVSPLKTFIKSCKPSHSVDVENMNAEIKAGGGFGEKIEKIAINIMLLAGILAIGAIAYGGILMTLSGGNDERIGVGKKIFSWALLGFFGIISAGGIITIVIKLMFELG